MENKIYDIIIIGAGPAGMTAAIYAGRANKSVCLIDKEGFGGNIAKSPKVENIPGFVSIAGVDFATNMYEQVCNLPNVEHVIEEVVLLNYNHGLFKISLSDNSLVLGLSVIIATGTTPRKLGLTTNDVYYCVTCDGPLFKNKNVFVVGSGNTGATYALELSTYCKNVYLCDISDKMLCEKTLVDRISETKNIFWLPATVIKDTVDKDGKLASVKTSHDEVIKCNAIFSAIGMIPQTDFVGQFAKTNDKNYLVSSNIPGVFIAGDCRDSKVKQVTTAVSDGTYAALDAINFVNNLK